MSIYIPGMEIPKDGWITLRIYPTGDVGIIVDGDCKYHDVAIPVPPHGRWIVKGNAQPISNDKVYGCSLCDDKNRRYYEWQLSNYCPNCGAKMDGE